MSKAQGGFLVPPPTKFEPVLIMWRDSVQFVDSQVWKPIEYIKFTAKMIAPIIHETVGFLIDETDEYYLIAHSIRPDGATSGALSIPKSEIIHLTPLFQVQEKDAD